MSDRGTAQLDVGGGVTAFAEYGVVHFERLTARRPSSRRRPSGCRSPGASTSASRRSAASSARSAREPGVLDRAALGDEPLVRSWRAGDRIAPLGLRGSKSLQDLFTARRVPRRERAGVAVVESGGEIVWLAGVATSERFKVMSPRTSPSA